MSAWCGRTRREGQGYGGYVKAVGGTKLGVARSVLRLITIHLAEQQAVWAVTRPVWYNKVWRR